MDKKVIKTTIRLDADLIRTARIYAAEHGLRGQQAVIEEALRRLFLAARKKVKP